MKNYKSEKAAGRQSVEKKSDGIGVLKTTKLAEREYTVVNAEALVEDLEAGLEDAKEFLEDLKEALE